MNLEFFIRKLTKTVKNEIKGNFFGKYFVYFSYEIE